MAVLAATHPTLLDLAKRLDPNDKIARIAEYLHQYNEILEDMVWCEGNLPTGMKTTVRTGLPVPTWRKLYGGVLPGKSTTQQVVSTCGMLEAYAEVDKALADLANNRDEFLLSENVAHIESMAQELAQTAMYGNESTEPEAFTGFQTHFNSLGALNGENILGAVEGTGTADNASIYLVVWSPQTVCGIYPKGGKAGLTVNYLGEDTIQNANDFVGGSVGGGKYQALVTHYKWDAGLCVRDWRYVVRIQFDIGDITATGATGPVLYDLMAKATRRIPNLNMGRAAFYMNRDTMDAYDLQAMHNPTMAFKTIEDAQGKFVNMFRGIPIRRVDQLLSTEAVVT